MKMKATLSELIKAIDGIAVMSYELEKMYKNIFNN